MSYPTGVLNRRNATLDWLKLLLAVAVIGIHTSPLLHQSPLISYLMVNGLFRMAVPTFLVIAGFYLQPVILDKRRLREWCIRLAVLYGIWMLIYLTRYLPKTMSLRDVWKFVATLFFGWFHLWYLVATLLGGLLLYLMKKLGDGWVAFAVVVGLIGGIALQYDMRYAGSWLPVNGGLGFENNSLYQNFIFAGFPYMGVGYLLARYDVAAKCTLPVLIAVFCLGALMLVGEAVFNYVNLGPDIPFDLMISLPACVVALFLITQKFQMPRGATWLAPLATVMYLAHPRFLGFLVKAGFLWGTQLFILTAVATLLAAPILIKLSRRYPAIL